MLQKNAHISPYRLTDRYDLGEGRVFLTGTQAGRTGSGVLAHQGCVERQECYLHAGHQ